VIGRALHVHQNWLSLDVQLELGSDGQNWDEARGRAGEDNGLKTSEHVKKSEQGEEQVQASD
jgi:hypothetical protein